MRSKFPIYLINLDRSPDRLSNANRKLDVANIKAVRISAVDGLGLTAQNFPGYDDAITQSYFGRSMTSGEVGCYMSHIKALQSFLTSGADCCLVLEDDFDATSEAWDIVDQIAQLSRNGSIKNWDIINLTKPPSAIYRHLCEMRSGAFHTILCRSYYFPTLATANLWSRSGAERFIEEAGDPFCPIDHLFRKRVSEDSRGLALSVPAFVHTKKDSDIQSASPDWQKPPKIGMYRFKEITRQLRCLALAKLHWHKKTYM